MHSLFVNEVFVSLQGEGHFAGTPAIFVRLQGCDVHCPWCDTGYAMSRADNLRSGDNDFSVLAKETASASFTCVDEKLLCDYLLGLHPKIRHLVLTGGEPFLQNIAPFMRLALNRGVYVQVETSGTRPISLCGEPNVWITLSPKRTKLPLEENWLKADEIKIPIACREDADFFLPRALELVGKRPIIALQPVSQDRDATRLCVELCLQHNLHLSLQTHKYINFR